MFEFASAQKGTKQVVFLVCYMGKRYPPRGLLGLQDLPSMEGTDEWMDIRAVCVFCVTFWL